MGFAAALAVHRARLAALNPYLTQAPTSVMMNLIQPFISKDQETNTAIISSAQDITYTTASGQPLRNKAQDYNVTPSDGAAATISVVLSVQSPATSTIVIPGNTTGTGATVGTGGDGLTTPAVNFTLQAPATISSGQTLANTFIGAITNSSGTSMGTGLAGNINQSPVPPTALVAAIWTVTATTSGGSGVGEYTLTKTVQTSSGPVTTTVATGLGVGSFYGSGLGYIPGIAFGVTGTIANGDSASFETGSTPVAAVCTAPGTIGNVLAGTVTTINTAQAIGVQVSNATIVQGVTNSLTISGITVNGGGVGGVDPDDDPQIRNKIAAVATPVSGAQRIINAMLAVAGVADAYLYDPLQDAAYVSGFDGHVYYYWMKADGTTLDNGVATITGGSASSGSETPAVAYIGSPTLSGTAALVDAAVRAALPAGLVPRLGRAGDTSDPFDVVFVTAIALSYSAATTVQASVVDPLILAAVIAYFNGIVHDQVPSFFGLSQAVQQAVGGALTNLTVSSVTPSTTFTDTAAATKVYRAASNITVTITP